MGGLSWNCSSMEPHEVYNLRILKNCQDIHDIEPMHPSMEAHNSNKEKNDDD